ncbi:MAG: hypothetical protein PHW46_03210 [Candidatus Omnitrophica bacterium]|nr:hypothetical protein [Candidatus Omnitrophota bacterium]
MAEYTTKDSIDVELSKAYFNNNPEKRKKRLQTSPVKPAKKQISPKIIALICLIAIVSLFSLVYFANNGNNKNVKSHGAPKAIAAQTKGMPLTATTSSVIPAGATSHTRTIPKPYIQKYNLKKVTTLYDFEFSDETWEIPGWEFEKTDHAAQSLQRVKGLASKGSHSLELLVNFPGGKWTGALAEVQQYLDLSGYDLISVDIYLPPDAPWGLRGKIIFSSGEEWNFNEMTRGSRLYPGMWITVNADMTNDNNTDWKKLSISKNIKQDVRKVAVRIESEITPYSGPIYIDNLRVAILNKSK